MIGWGFIRMMNETEPGAYGTAEGFDCGSEVELDPRLFRSG